MESVRHSDRLSKHSKEREENVVTRKDRIMIIEEERSYTPRLLLQFSTYSIHIVIQLFGMEREWTITTFTSSWTRIVMSWLAESSSDLRPCWRVRNHSKHVLKSQLSIWASGGTGDGFILRSDRIYPLEKALLEVMRVTNLLSGR